jgi:hypothetical protein
VADENLPNVLAGSRFYEPTRRGAEREIAERLEARRARRARGEPSEEGGD